ncbi:MAG: DUF5011 domain-containing protein, partial [Bacteroidetes bacterium]|nr:DUF5011 domain-containing protein [Bacteroidota bacterium]
IITEDRKAPVVFLNGMANMTLEQCATFTDLGAYAVDNVDGNISANAVSNSVDMSTPGTYTVVYEAKDAAGNTGSATRTVTVTADATNPVLTLDGNAVLDLEVFNTYTEPGFTATDNCDGNITANVVVTGSINDSTLGISTLTYTVTDKEGNQTVVTRTINVVDTEAPTVTLLGNAIDTVEIYTSYIEAGIDITDNYYTGLNYRVDGTVNLNRLGSYTLTYTSTDGSGNVSEQLTRTVYVLDLTAPSIVLAYGADTTVLVDVFSKYNLEYADLDDNYSSKSALRTTLTTGGTYVNAFGNGAATQLGDYIIEYTVTDESGNSTTVSRNIKVVDREAPMLTFTANPVVINRWQAFDPMTNAGAMPTDNYYGETELTVSIINSDLDVTSAGAYKVEFQVEDPSGNQASNVLDVWVLESTSSISETEFVADIYPNPTNGLLNINVEFENAAQTNVAVLNAMGQVVMNVSNGITQTINESIDLSQLGSGIYYVRIVNSNFQLLEKVVVSK